MMSAQYTNNTHNTEKKEMYGIRLRTRVSHPLLPTNNLEDLKFLNEN